MQLIGADEQHVVNDVAFDEVSILGQSLAADSENMRIGDHVEKVQFGAKKP